MTHHRIGDVIERDGARWRVVLVWRRLSPGDADGRTTAVRVVGYGYGLRRIEAGRAKVAG